MNGSDELGNALWFLTRHRTRTLRGRFLKELFREKKREKYFDVVCEMSFTNFRGWGAPSKFDARYICNPFNKSTHGREKFFHNSTGVINIRKIPWTVHVSSPEIWNFSSSVVWIGSTRAICFAFSQYHCCFCIFCYCKYSFLHFHHNLSTTHTGFYFAFILIFDVRTNSRYRRPTLWRIESRNR